MSLSIIVAISENYCIGKQGTLPWHIKEDLKHFKQITTGHTVIMGRKTWESIPETYRPLPNRNNVVITSQPTYPLPPHVTRYTSLQEALQAHAQNICYIIGGGQLYQEAFPLVDTLHVTHVHKHVDGDTFFPKINPNEWQETERQDHKEYSFVTYKKIIKITPLKRSN